MTETSLRDWVLLLDDDPWALEIVRTMLDHHGIPVHAAQTEEAALGTIQRLGAPAVLLLDVMMPGANGFEVCRRLRARAGLRHTRVVFATALDDEPSRLAALEAGADDLLTKPISEALLITRIRSLLELARLRDRDDTRLEYETVLNTIGEGVITLDEDDNIVIANGAARRLLGLPDPTLEVVNLTRFIAQHAMVTTGTIERSSNARLILNEDESGAAVALDWISRELPDRPDRQTAWTVVIRDATDAWERDKAVGRLIRTLSHKLRTPITGVSTSLELIAEDGALGDETRALVEIASDSSRRLSDTFVRILEFTQAISSANEPSAGVLLEPHRIREQLGLDAGIDLSLDLQAPVRLDLDLAGRGVRELATNATNAGAQRLSLRVATNPDLTVTFALSDDGEALLPGLAERLFEPFYQIDRSGEGAGAGLGLAILAAEVESRGGAVGAEAPIGGPTTVWFRLPNQIELTSPG